MRPLLAILAAKLRMARHALAAVRRQSRLKVAVVSAAAVLLWLGAFLLARQGFRWLDVFGAELLGTGSLRLADLVTARLFSVFALALLVLLVFSNLVVAYATFYRTPEVAYLVQAPVAWRTLFLARFWECVTFSSWASAFLGSPILLALGLERGAPPLFYLAALLFYLPFVVIPAALGVVLALALVRLLAPLPRPAWALVGVAAGAAAFLAFRGRLSAPDLSAAFTLPALIQAMGRTQSPFLPSFWAAEGVLAAADGNLGTALFDFLLLASTALFAAWLGAEAAARLFYPGWSALQGLDRDRSRPPGRGIFGRLDRLLGFLRQPARALAVKDLKLFWRDPAQWTQFVLFFGLMALYVANLEGGSGLAGREPWRSWITLLNLGASLLVLATLTTRFVFPLVSLEGRRFWILGLAPVSLGEIVRQKFWLSVASTSLFTLGVAALSGWRLDLAPRELFFSLFAVATGTFALCGLAVGLGSLYPNFEEANPARIVSGLGGTLNFILSLVYVVAVALTLTALLQWRQLARALDLSLPYPWAAALLLGLLAALGAAVCLVPLRLGLRNLERVEF